MGAFEFIRKLGDQGKSVEFLGNLDQNFTVNQDFFKCSKISIRHSTFKKLSFENLNINEGIVFESCTFESIYFSNVTSKSSPTAFHERSGSIIFINCIFSDYILMERCYIDKSVKFESNCQSNKIIINDLTTYIGGLYLENIEINTVLELNHNRITNGIEFRNCNINGNIRLQDNYAFSISIIDNHFKGNVWIWGGELPHGLIFNGGVFEKDFHIQYVNGGETLTFIGCNFYDICEVQFYDNDHERTDLRGFSKIYILSSSFKRELIVDGSKAADDQFYIDDITIHFTPQLVGNFSIINSYVKNFNISGDNFNATLSVSRSVIKSINIKDFSNYNNLKFIHLNTDDEFPDAEFNIINSNLGKAQFFNIDFDKFKFVTAINSFLSDIILSNIKWFDFNKLNKNPKIFSDDLFETNTLEYKHDQEFNWASRKEICRQLKVATEKHGNRTDSLLFQSLEMKFYEQQLKYSNKKSLLDQVILWTNNSNEHGLNWWRPVWLSLITTIILYCGIIISASNVHYFSMTCDFNKIWNSVKFLWSERGLMPQLFNPVRNLATIFKDKEGFTLTISTHVWDLCQRILISYFLFQTVSAFRKFNKN